MTTTAHELEIAGMTLMSIERMTWTMYAEDRFTLGGSREQQARKDFERQCTAAYDRMRDQARRNSSKLDFTAVDLRLRALQALVKGCTYCTELFGLANFGFVYDLPPGRTQSRSYGAANLVVCCGDCAEAKGPLSGSEWLDVVAALKAAENDAARATVRALVMGRREMDRRGRGRGSSSGHPVCG